jgi:hypothetical protein
MARLPHLSKDDGFTSHIFESLVTHIKKSGYFGSSANIRFF